MDRGFSEEESREGLPLVGPFGIAPSHVLMIAAVPLCAGAYSGYQKQVKRAAAEAREASKLKGDGNISAPRLTPDGRILASRALGIGTMLSFGGFALLGAASFYISGCRSFDEAFASFRRWGRKRRKEMEEWCDIDFGKDHPDFSATKGMFEDEELEYIRKKYLSDDAILKTTPKKSIARNWWNAKSWNVK
jgi:hypothetical protein